MKNDSISMGRKEYSKIIAQEFTSIANKVDL